MKPGQVHVHFVAIVPLILSTQAPLVQSRVFSYTRFYTADDSKCSGIPQFIDIEEQTDSLDGCTPEECSATAVGNYGMVNCIPNDQEETALIYEAVNAPYVLVEVFSPDYAPCGMLSRALALHADGRCRALPTTAYSAGIAVVNADLSLEVHLYNGTECDGDALDFDVSSGDVGSACNTEYAANSFKFYASKTRSGSSMASGSSWGGNSSSQADHLSGSSISDSALSTGSSSSSMSGGVIAGVGAGCLVIVLIFAAVVFYRKKTSGRSVNSPGHSPDKDDYDGDLLAYDATTTTTSSQRTGSSGASNNAENLWNDEVIVAARIPRVKVVLQQRVSRGGYGEVYVGTFNSQRVAIKMLLPETRKRIQSVNAFLSEVKLMASLEHPQIVEFIGVAWDSLTDLCVVSQFMDGGDLRALLNRYESERVPVGFDYTKAKIAFDVAHALTYMHSLAPVLVHRDLKSKNILLSNELDAKLTDFGASRERVDRTMTAGVGTSLWMAPEMILGEKYDEKADMFSFGVVLSELDSHALPYANARRDRLTSDIALLQLVMQGSLRVEFSDACPPDMKELGLACVENDPAARPSAAQALYKLQVVLAQQVQEAE